MNPAPAEQEVSTEVQRQALDAMSAELVNKLNSMIEEQNARVQTFASQYPDAPVSAAPLVENTPHPAPQPPATQPPPVAPLPTPRPQRRVTPPPAAKPRTETPPPIRPQQAPAQHKAAAPAKDKSENSIGCGPLVVIIAIIVILLRCCS